jgi:hypothetical protein
VNTLEFWIVWSVGVYFGGALCMHNVLRLSAPVGTRVWAILLWPCLTIIPRGKP